MRRASRVLAYFEPDGWVFYCPGCACHHRFPDDGRWTFDGDCEAPTFSPSLVTRYGKELSRICHLFVQGGKIVYLGDCTHALAGSTIPMEPQTFLDPGEDATACE